MSKLHELLIIGFMIGSFVLGYGYRNAQVSKTTDQTTQVRDNHTVVTTVTTKQKEGVKTVRTIDSTVKTSTKEVVKQPTQPKAQLNVSALTGYDFSSPHSLTPIYGISVTKQVFGPLTVGAFGLTNGVVGVSLGMNF